MIGSVDGRRDVAGRRSARTFWPSTAYWTLVGACAAFGLATAFTYGPLFFLAAAALLILGLIVRVIDKRASPAHSASSNGVHGPSPPSAWPCSRWAS